MANLIIVLYVMATTSAIVLLKLGASDAPPVSIVNSRLAFNINLLIALGGILYATSFILYTYLVAKFELGFIIPLTTAIVYILIFAASFMLFNEHFTIMKTVAIVLIVGGVVLLNIK